MPQNDDWLSQTPEEALEPHLPILDPHHHLWDHIGRKRRDRYLLDDIVADTASHGVRQTVFIECNSMFRAQGPDALKPIGETEFVQGIAAQSASGGYGAGRVGAGIVGTADLLLGEDIAPVLEAHLAASPNRFRGIRHRAAGPELHPIPGQPESREHLLMDATFRRGFALLRPYGLSFEAWVYSPSLPEVSDLAAAFPDTTIVLNHLGGPILTDTDPDELFAAWKDDIATLAAHPRVVVKLGGIQMPVNGFGWHERATPPSSDELVETNRRWYEHAIEQFGPERSMFESNFPVDRASCSYTVLWNQFKKLSAGFSAEERLDLFHDTAARTYRLPLASDAPA